MCIDYKIRNEFDVRDKTVELFHFDTKEEL